MKLFKSTDGFNVEIDPEILLIKSFSDLYMERNGDEVLIRAELAFIYFFNDPVSDFMYELDDKLRMEDVKKHVNLSPSWYPDVYIEECTRVYKELSETTASYLLATTKKMAQKIRDQMEAIDLSKLDKNDKPVYDIKKFIESAKAIPGLIEVLVKAEKEFIRDQQEASMNKGSKTKSIYEDM